MTTLTHRRSTDSQVRTLILDGPDASVTLGEEHRESLTTRFKSFVHSQHRRIDAWTVEQSGRVSRGFLWTPVTARRIVGNAALRRVLHQTAPSLIDAVHDEVTDHLLRAAAGYARPGSLSHWLSGQGPAVLGLVTADSLNWATDIVEATQRLEEVWHVAANDVYYDVAGARTTLRARRDLVVERGPDRVILRFRGGSPGKSAGPGLRADLIIETLAHPDGVAPLRIIGLWPEAGVCLAVDGTIGDLRAGARDLVRTAAAQERYRVDLAA